MTAAATPVDHCRGCPAGNGPPASQFRPCRKCLDAACEETACSLGYHDIRADAFKCGACKKELCQVCQADDHSAHQGHDLSNPMYWGV